MNVTSQQQSGGTSEGTVVVGAGERLVMSGVHEGAVEVGAGGHVELRGVVRGPLTIGSLGTVFVAGDMVGPVEIRVAGTLVVEPEGRISGEVTNFGSFTNRGLRAGRVAGRTPDDQPGSVAVDAPLHPGGASYHLPERG